MTPGLPHPPHLKLALASLLNLPLLLGPSQCGFCPPVFISLTCPPAIMRPLPRALHGPACPPSVGPVLASSLSSQPQPPPLMDSTALWVMPWQCQPTPPSAPRAPLAGFSSLTIQSPTGMDGVAMMSAPRWRGFFVFSSGHLAPRTGSGPWQELQNYPPLNEWVLAMCCTRAGPCNGPHKNTF